LARRPWRTSWLIVGTKTLLLSEVMVDKAAEPRVILGRGSLTPAETGFHLSVGGPDRRSGVQAEARPIRSHERGV
jgi:hypothetical protein